MLNAIPFKILARFSNMDKLILKFALEIIDCRKAKTKKKTKKKKAGGITLFKASCLSSIQECVALVEDRHTGQWNRRQNPERTHKYAQRLFTKVRKLFNGEKTAFSASAAGTFGYLEAKPSTKWTLT